ncbi:ATP-binding cassette domain-containing protein [Rhodococcus sp. HNM0569]|nr:ATP-binding cassette domain-containing protein [Rhodococcus sp. HNM0569]
MSFAVPRGSITGFLGPNGSGKTTTLRMALGLVTPTAGFALVHGEPVRSMRAPGRVVGAVLDAQTMHPKRTAREHLRIYTAAMGVPDRRADDVLDQVGLLAVARRRVGEFSLGMRGRLALATALLGDPSVLVLDEPANGLDPQGIAWLRAQLTEFAARGGTVLLSSHVLPQVQQIIDRVLVVSRGSLVYQGTLEALRRAQHSRLLVACSDPAALALALSGHGFPDARSLRDGRLAVLGADERALAAAAHDAHVTIFGVVDEQVDLEQLFLAMTAPDYVAGATAAAPGGYGAPLPPAGYVPPGPPPHPHGPPPPGYGPPPGSGYGPPPGYPPPHVPGGPR